MTAQGRPMLRQPVSDDDWARGPADAPVTVVEYLDFECPACQAAHPAIERVLASLPQQVRFVVRHMPIASAHPRAERAALAAEAAGGQGKFWEMHDRLLESAGALADDDLRRYAADLGLDLARFERDAADGALLDKIRAQKLAGIRSGVNGTPTLYIDGLRYDGHPADEATLMAAIQTELSKSHH